MVTEAAFYGGAREHAPGADVTLWHRSARLQVMTPSAGGLDVFMPDARTLPLGGPQFVLVNLSGSNSMTVKAANGTTILTLGTQEGMWLALRENVDLEGKWLAKVNALGTGRAYKSNLPPAATLFYMFAGGNEDPDGPHFENVNSYLVSGDSWSARQPMPEPLTWMACNASYQGAAYIAGGANGAGIRNEHRKYVKGTDSWESLLRTLNPRRYGPSSDASGSKIYMMSGRGQNAAVEDNDEYDPAADSWAEKSPVPKSVNVYVAVLAAHAANSKVYHWSALSVGSGFITENDEYDPSGDSWANKNQTGLSSYWSARFKFAADIHQCEGGTLNRRHTAYNPAGDSFAAKLAKPLPAIQGPYYATIGGKGYFAGGHQITIVPVTTNYEYDPVGNTWASKQATPSPAMGGGESGTL